MAGSQSKALPRWVTLTLQSHFTTSMHFHCLQNPPSLIVPTASNIPSNLYSSYLQEYTRTPPPPLPPPKPPTALLIPRSPSSPQSCRPLQPISQISHITQAHPPSSSPVRPAPVISSKRYIHRDRRHCHHQMSSRASTSSVDIRRCPGPMWRGMETRSRQELDVV